jgi:biopolymer transport protein ExbB
MQMDLAHIWSTMGLMSRLVAVVLVIMALASVGVVLERMLLLRKARLETARFAEEARPALIHWDLAELLAVADRYETSPFARLTASTVRAFERALEDHDGGLDAVELARREKERRKEALGEDLRRGLGVLASVGSVAPFVGLLGTVIGIITAFQSIAAKGSGGLGAVSAGISEALIVTALGLGVAIPAVLLFNWLTTRIDSLELALERRAGELLDVLENEHGRTRSGRRLHEAA